MPDHDLELISFDICPYVERSRIVLEQKGVDYEYTDIDLSDKPDWFLDISPRGKVPVLLVDDEPIFESNVINELLEELYPEPAMMPAEPLDRARARAWIAFNNDELMGPSYRLYSGKEGADEAREDLEEALEKVDEQLGRHDGRFFLGDTFSLVDAVYAPMFNRWPMMGEFGHGDLLDDFDRVRTYRDTLQNHPSVQAGKDDELLDKLRDRA